MRVYWTTLPFKSKTITKTKNMTEGSTPACLLLRPWLLRMSERHRDFLTKALVAKDVREARGLSY